MANPFIFAMQNLSTAARLLKLKPKFVAALRKPEHIWDFDIPVVMDNKKKEIFHGYRVQYSSARGPYKGGIRFHPATDLNEVKALAFWMAVKCATVGIPYGGAKGGVTVDSKKFSVRELERLSRGYVRALFDHIGPEKDIPAPDVNTTPQIMAWMMDEFAKIRGYNVPGVVTGKPLAVGGSQGREEATGRGGFYVFEELTRKLKLNPKKTRIVLQGFGNVGYHFARFAHAAGYAIVGISDSKGGIVAPKDSRFDPEAVMQAKMKKESVQAYPAVTLVTNDELLTTSCDILVPSALENQITKHNAKNIRAKVVLELANGPTTPDADVILKRKKVIVVPDVLANAGGVTVSYFEWVQNIQNFYWTAAEVDSRLKPIMVRSFHEVWEMAAKKKTTLRMGAYCVAIDRIVKAMELRGW